MKYLIIIMFLASCCHPALPPQEQIVFVHDTIYGASAVKCDSVMAVNDSLDKALFKAAFAIERIKYYVATVDRKPSNIKYLKGWIKRAIQ
jgi:hypothetical protein